MRAKDIILKRPCAKGHMVLSVRVTRRYRLRVLLGSMFLWISALCFGARIEIARGDDVE